MDSGVEPGSSDWQSVTFPLLHHVYKVSFEQADVTSYLCSSRVVWTFSSGIFYVCIAILASLLIWISGLQFFFHFTWHFQLAVPLSAFNVPYGAVAGCVVDSYYWCSTSPAVIMAGHIGFLYASTVCNCVSQVRRKKIAMQMSGNNQHKAPA